MPIIHFANSKNQTTGGLKKLLGYVRREKKTKLEDGRKYHSDNNSLHELMKLSDEICESYGVHTLQKPTFNKDGQNDVLGDKEYRSAVRGESFKFALMNAITDCMKQAKSKKQFIALMKRKGYDVR